MKAQTSLIFILLINFVMPFKGTSQRVMNIRLDSLVTPAFEKIDSNILYFQIRHLTPKGLVFDMNGDTTDVGGVIYIRNSPKEVIRKIKIEASRGLQKNAPIVYVFSEFINSYFAIEKTFHGNGNIYRKSIVSWLGFSIGTGYWFNEKGKLIKIEDFDKHYKFTFDDILNFCRQNNISISRNETGDVSPSLRRLKYNGRPSWFITSWYPKVNQWVTIILDGKNGELRDISPVPLNPE